MSGVSSEVWIVYLEGKGSYSDGTYLVIPTSFAV